MSTRIWLPYMVERRRVRTDGSQRAVGDRGDGSAASCHPSGRGVALRGFCLSTVSVRCLAQHRNATLPWRPEVGMPTADTPSTARKAHATVIVIGIDPHNHPNQDRTRRQRHHTPEDPRRRHRHRGPDPRPHRKSHPVRERGRIRELQRHRTHRGRQRRQATPPSLPVRGSHPEIGDPHRRRHPGQNTKQRRIRLPPTQDGRRQNLT